MLNSKFLQNPLGNFRFLNLRSEVFSWIKGTDLFTALASILNLSQLENVSLNTFIYLRQVCNCYIYL